MSHPEHPGGIPGNENLYPHIYDYPNPEIFNPTPGVYHPSV